MAALADYTRRMSHHCTNQYSYLADCLSIGDLESAFDLVHRQHEAVEYRVVDESLPSLVRIAADIKILQDYRDLIVPAQQDSGQLENRLGVKPHMSFYMAFASKIQTLYEYYTRLAQAI